MDKKSKGEWFITADSMPLPSMKVGKSQSVGSGDFKILHTQPGHLEVKGQPTGPEDSKGMTKAKFGKESPNMQDECKLCGKPYGVHHSYHCPSEQPPEVPDVPVYDDDEEDYEIYGVPT